MNEIEKMYENVGIKPICDGLDCWTCIAKCNNGKYPEFTTEKQLELIKFLAKGEIVVNNEDGEFEFACRDITSNFGSFEEALAGFINTLWDEYLAPEEKQQIKEILE